MHDHSFPDFARRIHGPGTEDLPVPEVQAAIHDCVDPVEGTERLPLRAALGRVLACDIVSPIDVPPHDNSAMDGYAFCGRALVDGTPATLRLAGTVLAGSGFSGVVAAGHCVRIMTGAPMPEGCDTVVPQETAHLSGTEVLVPAGVVSTGDNRRRKGEDLCLGMPALYAGRMIKPADLGLLASLGIADVAVRRRLRVAVFSTGDELRPLGAPLDPGSVYDSNRLTLYGMLARIGCEVVDMGIVKDDPVALEGALRSACETTDAVITSGGVSVGDADHMRYVLTRLGDVAFWRVAMRPGRPMAFGHLVNDGKRTVFFGLPGNPVAVMVAFYFFARTALLRMMGAQATPLPLARATAVAAIRKRPGRTEYQRGIFAVDPDGRPSVRVTGAQGSGILRSMSEANCMVVLHHDQGSVKEGEQVDVLLFDGLV